MKRFIFFSSVLVCIVGLSCKEEIFYSVNDALIDPRIQPKVIFTNPRLNSKGPYPEFVSFFSKLTIRFNKIMDQNSVRQALAIKSPFRKIGIWGMTGVDGSTFTFLTSDSTYGGNMFDFPKLREVFTLYFKQPVEDCNGNMIPPGDIGTLEPEPYFLVKNVNPPDGSVISRYSNYFDIYFNSEIDSTIWRYINISPPASIQKYSSNYSPRWIGFSFNDVLPSQQYTVTVTEGASDKYGNRIGSPFSYMLQTEEFWTRSADSVFYLPRLYSKFSIEFTSPLDSLTVQSAFNIFPEIQFSLSTYNDAIHFEPGEEYAASTEYTVTIDSTLRTIHGVKLGKNLVLKYRTPAFRVVSTNPANGEGGFSRRGDISFEFSAYLDTSTIRKSFSLSPAVPGMFLFFERSKFYFYSYDSLVANQWYSVGIDTTARSVGGSYLQQPYSFSFKTGSN